MKLVRASSKVIKKNVLNHLTMDSDSEIQRSSSKPGFMKNITCTMCKQERRTKERMLMFGGRRPLMANFEGKLIRMVGREKLLTLKKETATNQGRSYICKQCHSLIDKTYENILKVQQGIARSVEMALQCQPGANNHHSLPAYGL